MFKDPWLPQPVSFKVVLISTNESTQNYLVKEFITSTFQWDVLKLNQLLRSEDVDVIKNLPIRQGAPDTWIRHYDHHGQY